MKNYFLIISILLFSSSVLAKDVLVPAFIDGQNDSENVLFEYKDITPEEKKVVDSIKQHKQDNIEIRRVAPKVETEKREVAAPKVEKSALPILPNFIVKAKPIEPRRLAAPKGLNIEHIFDIPSFKLQSRLRCPMTPNLKAVDPNMPKQFNRTNNARRKTKSPEVSRGHIIYIKGRVLDVNCTPVQGALVRLWQANAFGGFNHQLKTNNSKYDPDFVGSAMATSNNLGHFDLITILPGRTKNVYAPNLNFNATHKNFNPINTKYFFPQNKFNREDGRFMSLDPVSQELLTGILLPINPDNFDEGYYYLVDLVFNGVSRFRK